MACSLTGKDLPEGTAVVSFPGSNSIATVAERKNRFLVTAMHNGKELLCHLHDPGRLKELIYPGNSILVRKTAGIRTEYSVTGAMKNGDWILTDSRFHNRIAARFLRASARREVPVGKSRIDFLDGDCYVEVKGCSLETEGKALFPDAPSARATKHMNELAKITREGMCALALVLVFSPAAEIFQPNESTDPEFYSAFYRAMEIGVHAVALKFRLNEGSIVYMGRIPVAGLGK